MLLQCRYSKFSGEDEVVAGPSGLTALQNALVGAVSSVFSQFESSKSESDEDFEPKSKKTIAKKL